MVKRWDRPLWVRGLAYGFLASLVNGLSLPVLLEVYLMLAAGLDTGQWRGPMGIMELWAVWFVSGFAFSLLPGILTGIALGLGMQYMLSTRMPVKLLSASTEVIVAVCSAACYVFLLLFCEVLMSRETHTLGAILFTEQLLIYGWMAAHLSARHRVKT